MQRPAAKTIYVSQSKGTDTRTGLSKYSLHTPFATLTAAAGAAAAGDTIVAEDGVFTDKNLVLVTGVDWLFLPAASVVVTGATNGDVIFKDGGTAATAVIAGCGQTFSISSTHGRRDGLRRRGDRGVEPDDAEPVVRLERDGQLLHHRDAGEQQCLRGHQHHGQPDEHGDWAARPPRA